MKGFMSVIGESSYMDAHERESIKFKEWLDSKVKAFAI